MNTLSLAYFNEQCKTIKDPMHIIENMAATVMAEYNLKEGELKWHLGDTTCHAKFEHYTNGDIIATTVSYQENNETVTIIRRSYHENDALTDCYFGYEIHANKKEFILRDSQFVESIYCQQLLRVLQQ